MNRRNFILGLGTAATLSGAASVTGAALSDTAEPGADFRVIATDQLTVRRNGFLTQSGTNNYTEGGINFNEQDQSTAPNMSIDDGTDTGLNMSLATFNDATADYNKNFSRGGTLPYVNTSNTTNAPYGTSDGSSYSEAPLEIENTGGAGQEVAVQYSFGTDVGSGDNEVSEQEVLDLFTFQVGGQQISPTTTNENDDNSTDPPTVTVPSGDFVLVNLVINLTEDIESSIAAASSATGSYGFSSGATDDVDLLNTVTFGNPNA